MRVALISALVTALCSQATAQTQTEAAAQNIQLAITLCIQNGHDAATLQNAFATSGHSYSVEGEGTQYARHTYGTPDGTVTTAISFEGITAYCAISTEVFSVSQMIPFARAVADQLYTGPIWDESPEAVKVTPGSAQAANQPCTGFHFLPGRTTVWFQFGVAGQDPVCIDNGTAQIMISL